MMFTKEFKIRENHSFQALPENSTTDTDRGESRRIITNSSTVTIGIACAGCSNESIPEAKATTQESNACLLGSEISKLSSDLITPIGEGENREMQ
jgi:hypothetical protein